MVELMVALAAGSVVLMTTIQTLNHFQQRLEDQQELIGLHQDQRIGMRILEEELRMASSGTGWDHGLIRADQQEIEFNANVGGYQTNLVQPVSRHEEELHVRDGGGWRKGKRLVVCTADHCAEGRLEKEGRSASLILTHPLAESFPTGSEVAISNHIRYYVSRNRLGTLNLMREVDGGSNTIIADLNTLSFTYFDKQGKSTSNPEAITCVRVSLAVGKDRHAIVSEIGLRTR